MIRIAKILVYFLFLISVGSCALVGIHINVKNPPKAGKYPRWGNEEILLGENSNIRKGFDATFYNLDIRLLPSQKALEGWVEIRAIALNDIDSIQLDLNQKLTIDELRWASRDGQQLKYSRKYKAIFIQLPVQIKKTTTFNIHVKYHGNPSIAEKPPWRGGLVWKKDKWENHWAGIACESEGPNVWFPCKDHTSDEPDSAYMKFTIKEPDLFVVSNGRFMGKETKNDATTFSWKVSYPINLYNITFYLGDFVAIKETYTGINKKELAMTHYVLRPNVEIAKKHFQQVKEHLRVYEELYGEYPWYNDGFKLIESPYAGMEHQSAIAYGNGYKNDMIGGKDDYIIVHETGHEWFGNAITAADLADAWLQEGITTYGEALYLEKKYGKQEALNHLLFNRLFIKNKRPVVGPKGRRYFNYRDSDIYVKGAWILHTLRTNINNDSLFFLTLKTFYDENKLKVTDSKAFVETVNRITGKDFEWFFAQYLYQRKVPFFDYYYDPVEGAIYYRWKDIINGFNKLSVTVGTTGSEQKVDLYPDKHIQKLNLSQSKPPSDVVIDNSYALFGISRNKKLKKLFREQQAGIKF